MKKSILMLCGAVLALSAMSCGQETERLSEEADIDVTGIFESSTVKSTDPDTLEFSVLSDMPWKILKHDMPWASFDIQNGIADEKTEIKVSFTDNVQGERTGTFEIQSGLARLPCSGRSISASSRKRTRRK